MGQQQVMDGGYGCGWLGVSGRVDPGPVPEQGGAPRFVQGRPGRHAVTERLVHRPRVLGETIGRVAARRAAGVLEGLGQVPVVQRDPGLDAVFEQLSTSRE